MRIEEVDPEVPAATTAGPLEREATRRHHATTRPAPIPENTTQLSIILPKCPLDIAFHPVRNSSSPKCRKQGPNITFLANPDSISAKVEISQPNPPILPGRRDSSYFAHLCTVGRRTRGTGSGVDS